MIIKHVFYDMPDNYPITYKIGSVIVPPETYFGVKCNPNYRFYFMLFSVNEPVLLYRAHYQACYQLSWHIFSASVLLYKSVVFSRIRH